MSMTDQQLLQAFLQHRDGAFSQLVERHLPLVYHTAARMVGAANADDMTQAVFALLSAKAEQLIDHPSLAGWLHHATRYCCQNYKKMEERRRRYETEAAMQKDSIAAETPAISDESRQQLRALLDEALARLKTPEREAVLLRYLENRTIEETATALAINPSAAAKRAERGLNRLRKILSSKGLALPAAALGLTLAAESTHAIPAVLLAASIAAPTSATATAAAASLGGNIPSFTTGTATVILGTKIAATIVIMTGLCIGAVMLIGDAGHSPRAAAPATPAPALPPAAIAPEPPPPLLAAASEDNLGLSSYGLLMEARIANQLQALGIPEATGSKGFHVVRMPAEVFHERIRQLHQREAIEVITPDAMIIPGNDTIAATLPPLDLPWRDPDESELAITGLEARWFSQGLPKTAYVNEQQQLVVELHQTLRGRYGIGTPDDRTTDFTSEIHIDSTLKNGDLLVHIGDAINAGGQVLSIVMVTECFAASGVQMPIMTEMNQTDLWKWVDYGADYSRWVAARAAIWASQAPRQVHKDIDVQPEWTRQVDADTTASIIAISRSDRGAFCWWDPAGQAVSGVRFWRTPVDGPANTMSVFYVVRQTPPVDESSGVNSRYSAWGSSPRFAESDGREWMSNVELVSAADPRAIINVAVGEGRRLGDMQLHTKAQNLDGLKLRFTYPIEPERQINIFCQVTYTDPVRQEVYFKLILHDGRVVPLLAGPRPTLENARENMLEKVRNYYVSHELKWKDVQRVEVWLRQRRSITFAPLAAEPLKPLPQHFGATQVAAAEQAIVNARFAREMQAEMQADPATPSGMWMLIQREARAGHIENIKAMMVTSDQREAAIADAMARNLAASEQLLLAARKRWPNIDSRDVLGSLLVLAADYMNLTWRINHDVAVMEQAQMFQLLRRDGRWMIDLRTDNHGGRMPAQILGYLERALEFSDVLEQVRHNVEDGQYQNPRSVLIAIKRLREEAQNNKQKQPQQPPTDILAK